MALRISTGILVAASILFAAGALGVLGTWALGAATVMALVGAIGAVTVLEGRDFAQSTASPTTVPDYVSIAGLASDFSDDYELEAA